MGLGSIIVLVGGGIASVIVLIVVAILFGRRSRPQLAVLDLRPSVPSAVDLPPGLGPIEIWIRYEVAFPFFKPFGAKTSRIFGMVVELALDDKKVAFGHGGLHPKDLDAFEGIAHYMTSFSPGDAATPTRYSATIMVKRFARRPRRLEAAVHGVGATAVTHAQITVS